MIQGKEYRYISPVFMCNAQTGEVLYFKSVGLTNTPAMDLILWKEPQQESEIMTMKEIALSVGLPEAASQEEITTAIIALRAKSESAANAASSAPVPALPPLPPPAPSHLMHRPMSASGNWKTRSSPCAAKSPRKP